MNCFEIIDKVKSTTTLHESIVQYFSTSLEQMTDSLREQYTLGYEERGCLSALTELCNSLQELEFTELLDLERAKVFIEMIQAVIEFMILHKEEISMESVNPNSCQYDPNHSPLSRNFTNVVITTEKFIVKLKTGVRMVLSKTKQQTLVRQIKSLSSEIRTTALSMMYSLFKLYPAWVHNYIYVNADVSSSTSSSSPFTVLCVKSMNSLVLYCTGYNSIITSIREENHTDSDTRLCKSILGAVYNAISNMDRYPLHSAIDVLSAYALLFREFNIHEETDPIEERVREALQDAEGYENGAKMLYEVCNYALNDEVESGKLITLLFESVIFAEPGFIQDEEVSTSSEGMKSLDDSKDSVKATHQKTTTQKEKIKEKLKKKQQHHHTTASIEDQQAADVAMKRKLAKQRSGHLVHWITKVVEVLTMVATQVQKYGSIGGDFDNLADDEGRLCVVRTKCFILSKYMRLMSLIIGELVIKSTSDINLDRVAIEYQRRHEEDENNIFDLDGCNTVERVTSLCNVLYKGDVNTLLLHGLSSMCAMFDQCFIFKFQHKHCNGFHLGPSRQEFSSLQALSCLDQKLANMFNDMTITLSKYLVMLSDVLTGPLSELSKQYVTVGGAETKTIERTNRIMGENDGGDRKNTLNTPTLSSDAIGIMFEEEVERICCFMELLYKNTCFAIVNVIHLNHDGSNTTSGDILNTSQMVNSSVERALNIILCVGMYLFNPEILPEQRNKASPQYNILCDTYKDSILCFLSVIFSLYFKDKSLWMSYCTNSSDDIRELVDLVNDMVSYDQIAIQSDDVTRNIPIIAFHEEKMTRFVDYINESTDKINGFRMWYLSIVSMEQYKVGTL